MPVLCAAVSEKRSSGNRAGRDLVARPDPRKHRAEGRFCLVIAEIT